MDISENNVIEEIESDEFYNYFLNSNSSKPSLLKTLSLTEQVKKLGEGIELINCELRKHVLEKHEDLLRQGNHATKLETVLNSMNLHVHNLVSSAEGLRNQIMAPYNALETHTKVLGRLHLASHILRQVNQIQNLSKRLTDINDPVQKASILYELKQLASDQELKDVEVVTAELRNIRTQEQKIINLAKISLTQGILNENNIQISTALHILVNLGILKETIQEVVELGLSECSECIKIAFDSSAASAIGQIKTKGPGKANLASSQGFRAKTWIAIEKVFNEDIYNQCKQIKCLQNALDTFNIDEFQQKHIAIEFWKKLGKMIQREINNSSLALQQMLDEDYPKLLKYYYDMNEKLKYKHFSFDRKIMEKCENAYLSNSLTKLMEPTQNMFGFECDAPSHDQIDTLIRIMSSELSFSLIEENLSEKICRNISKTIKMFSVKTEQNLETGTEAAQVFAGNTNSSQQLNVRLANSLYYLQTQVQRMVSNMKDNLPITGISIINEGIQSLINLTVVIIQPLVMSINTTVETIVITIHLETDWDKLPPNATRNLTICSPYMKELIQFLTRVYNTYLKNFDNKEILFLKCSEIAVRCIELFVRHSSLVRPVNENGRQRLHSDYLHLEQALKIICPHLSDLGRPYRLLKSMASLIILSPSEIIAGQATESSVSHSTVLLLLFSFAGNELTSPHQNMGWSLAELSTWLDEHPSESDRLDLIAGALQRYESLVRQKNSINWDPVYPIMSEFLQSAVTSLK